MVNVGILALQGAFQEHIDMLDGLGISSTVVRLPEQLTGIDGLIIPGGESTTIGKLAVSYDLLSPLRRFATEKPVWGVCAGMILLARDVGVDQPLIGVMDVRVERNAFGRQVDSFEIDLWVDELPGGKRRPFRGVFIRAPRLTNTGIDVHILVSVPGIGAVAARQGHWLVTAFHPELTQDTRFHHYFLGMIEAAYRDRPVTASS
ncbi:Pyridoxal 5'-phosphate synthase (glutamine hydrolyzing), glutaminase subunit (EC [Olavius algarvensis associated proteobacterium Delta 3]|nr:Pyridoxal 5'-phosphate synthase (glutamine hydrolyzing), glutaminase subunit (EC [Olavius algarvensis associated proteobacterium Delta 3]CAB5150740.1 Pyridoxal 5'-phosphate synthase (glutamine hydrolyzing), glutaminase subunit (EC [Olavius algarvensis associated proteobacterium Delta 3]